MLPDLTCMQPSLVYLCILCIKLVRGPFVLYRACVGMLARFCGTRFWAGLCVPTDAVDV